MEYLANTERLIEDGILTHDQAREIETRSRETFVALAINVFLCGGIIAATFGLIFWLGEPLPVAVSGVIALAAGALVLMNGGPLYRIFGNAAALIGTGMLIGGATFELLDRYDSDAAGILTAMGGGILVLALLAFWRATPMLRFAVGAIVLMGGGLHLFGLMLLGFENWAAALAYLYATAMIFALGIFLDIRLVSALAIVPFAQALDTSTVYFHAAYVFYSPESTLSILQMAALIGVLLWAMRFYGQRITRHMGVLAVLGFVVMNLCFLVGSLWGDMVGETIWGPGYAAYRYEGGYEAYNLAREAYAANAVEIGEGIYSIVWALVLAVVIAWSAFASRRGLFNAGMTFAAIHAYTQLFESFGDEPLAYVIGGLTAIPVAWGLFQLNNRMKARMQA